MVMVMVMVKMTVTVVLLAAVDDEDEHAAAAHDANDHAPADDAEDRHKENPNKGFAENYTA